jgi:hypothetical protein
MAYKKLTKEDRQRLDESVQKYRDAADAVREGRHNTLTDSSFTAAGCALCVRYRANGKSNERGCFSCPVGFHTDKVGCAGTPFHDDLADGRFPVMNIPIAAMWRYFRDRERPTGVLISQDHMVARFDAEADFLQSLIDNSPDE